MQPIPEMKKELSMANEAAVNPPSATDSATTRQRVLDAACFLFSEYGFHGTHMRDVCKRAKANVAAVCYHFQNKEKLFEAVAQEAYRQLSAKEQSGSCPADAPPEERLRTVVRSLFERLSGKGLWVMKLLARELLDPPWEAMPLIGAGLGNDLVLLQQAIRDLVGPREKLETVHLYVLSVVASCAFYSLAADKLHKVVPQLLGPLPARESLADHVASFSIEALRRGPGKETSKELGQLRNGRS
jgi:AcrR family transcriptional regulator